MTQRILCTWPRTPEVSRSSVCSSTGARGLSIGGEKMQTAHNFEGQGYGDPCTQCGTPWIVALELPYRQHCLGTMIGRLNRDLDMHKWIAQEARKHGKINEAEYHEEFANRLRRGEFGLLETVDIPLRHS